MKIKFGFLYVVDRIVYWIINKINGLGNNKLVFVLGIFLKV